MAAARLAPNDKEAIFLQRRFVQTRASWTINEVRSLLTKLRHEKKKQARSLPVKSSMELSQILGPVAYKRAKGVMFPGS